MHLDEDDIARILTLAKTQAITQLYALRAEPLQQVPEALALDLNDRALQAFEAFEHWIQANALNELRPVMAACCQNSDSGV